MSKSKKRHLVLQLPECSEDGCAPSVFVSTASFSAWLLGRPLTEDFSDKTWIMHDDVWSFLEKPVSEQQWKCHRITRTQFLMFLELLCPYRVAGRLDTATDFLWSKTKEMSPATCSQLERRSPGSKLNWSFAFGAVFTAAQEPIVIVSEAHGRVDTKFNELQHQAEQNLDHASEERKRIHVTLF